MHYTSKNIKNSFKNQKFKMSTRTWNQRFELPDESCSLRDIQDYFENILKSTWRKD